MDSRRTDLALEARELWQEGAGDQGRLEGVASFQGERDGFPCHTVDILNETGAQALGKPVGRYATLTMDGLARRERDAFGRAARAVAGELTALMGSLSPQAPVLVVGLGNRAITPDAVGPQVQAHTLATRHLVAAMPEQFGAFRPVAALAAGVLGTTGMESGELVQAVCRAVRPAWVCRTIQLSNAGIVPGSGVGNHRFALDEQTLGVPVAAIGVPTVVYGATLAADLLGHEPQGLGAAGDLLVTPKDLDSQVADLSKVIGYGINLALQPQLSVEDVELLLS